MNGKYVTFKTEDFDRIIDDKGTATKNELLRARVEDAVVIRMQDVFAAPALYAYANSIGIAVDILRSTGDELTAARLSKIADYFHECSEESADRVKKLPD